MQSYDVQEPQGMKCAHSLIWDDSYVVEWCAMPSVSLRLRTCNSMHSTENGVKSKQILATFCPEYAEMGL